MKSIFLTTLIFIFNYSLKAQTIVSFSPNNLIIDDTIEVATNTSFPFATGPSPYFCGKLIAVNDTIIGNKIELDLLFDVTGIKISSFCLRPDTFQVKLPSFPGNYLFKCYWSIVDSLSPSYNINRWLEDSIQIMVNSISNLKELYSRPLRFYPNPASDHLTIDAPSNMIESISITSIKGEVIFEGSSTNRINLTDYSQGIYFMQVQLSNGRIINEKLVVK
jgi:hypothetical protein